MKTKNEKPGRLLFLNPDDVLPPTFKIRTEKELPFGERPIRITEKGIEDPETPHQQKV